MLLGPDVQTRLEKKENMVCLVKLQCLILSFSSLILSIVGLLCHGEGYGFVVAHLGVRWTPKTFQFHAELWLLRSSSSRARGGDGGERWETKLLPVPYQDDDDCTHLIHWVTNEVVPFNNSLCWVDYSHGFLFCDGILGDDGPKVSYVRFPQDSFLRDHIRFACKDFTAACASPKVAAAWYSLKLRAMTGRVSAPWRPALVAL